MLVFGVTNYMVVIHVVAIPFSIVVRDGKGGFGRGGGNVTKD